MTGVQEKETDDPKTEQAAFSPVGAAGIGQAGILKVEERLIEPFQSLTE